MENNNIQLPLAVRVNRAEEEIGVAVMNTGKNYGLTATLLDSVLTGVASKVKDMKAAELAEVIAKALEEDTGNNE